MKLAICIVLGICMDNVIIRLFGPLEIWTAIVLAVATGVVVGCVAIEWQHRTRI